MRLIILILLILLSLKGNTQCGGTIKFLNVTNPGEIYRPSSASTWQPGDTILVVPTNLTVFEIYGNVGGSYECPVVIMAQTNFHSDIIRFKGGAHNFKLLSTGGGTDTTTIRSITSNNVALDQADHIEINGLEISGADVGFYNKMNVSYADRNSWFPAFPMTGNKLIGCWVHDIGGEGVYSGLTQENGYTVTSSYSGLDTVIVGNVSDSTIIMNCRVERTLWDGIQLAHGAYGNIIANNIVRNFGLSDLTNQRSGIILGGDCNGDVYNNTVKYGTGNGIEIFGFASINVYQNTMDSVGMTIEHQDGEESLYAVYHTVTYTSRPPLALNVYNNAINHPQPRGAIRNSTNGNQIASIITNNTFCIPEAAENWQSTYLILDVPGTTNTNNILQCSNHCNCTITNILKGGKYIN